MVEYALDSQSGWIQGRNLCYERKKQIWHSFSISGNPMNIRSYGKQCNSLVSLLPSLPLWMELPIP